MGEIEKSIKFGTKATTGTFPLISRHNINPANKVSYLNENIRTKFRLDDQAHWGVDDPSSTAVGTELKTGVRDNRHSVRRDENNKRKKIVE